MDLAFQTTIAAPVSYTGVGLHSGKDVTMKLQPAEADTGIVFTLPISYMKGMVKKG